MKFEDQIVVVIGASGGLGSEIARTFSKAGEMVVLAARDTAKLTALASELNASTHAVDVTDFNSVESLRNVVMQNYARVDVVINATGYDVRKAFEQHTAEDLRRTVDVNLLGAMNISHAFVRDMKDGVIAHLGGFADGRLAFPYYAADAASRAGVASFVEAMNRELRLEGKPVTLLYFSPSPADTDAERPFHELWRQMGTKIVSTEQVAAELRRAVIQKRKQYVMGGVLVNGFAKLNSAFPNLADALMLNQYGKKLQSFFGKAAGTEPKSSLALKAGLAMVIFSVALYGVIFSLPFFSISTANKLALTPVLMGISEIIFWVGVPWQARMWCPDIEVILTLANGVGQRKRLHSAFASAIHCQWMADFFVMKAWEMVSSCLQRRIMLLKPVRWKTFPREFLRIQIGFFLFGLAITLMIRGNIGTSAWAVLEVALASKLHISIGTMTVLMGFIVLAGALLMREQLGWGTLANILSIGPWEDFWLSIIPSVKDNLLLQSGMLLLAIFLMGLASAIYIGVDAGAGPRDSMMLAIKRTTGISIRVARAIIEVTVVTLGWLLGGPAGLGTVVYALLVGPSVQFGFKIFNVHPHGPEALIPQAPED